MTWQPILNGPDAARGFSLLERIAADLTALDYSSGTLGTGAAGKALFFGYLARGSQSEMHRMLMMRYLAAARTVVCSEASYYSLYHGATGIAWASEHLFRQHHDFETATRLDFLDGLERLVNQHPWRGCCDVADGLAGYGLWALADPLDCSRLSLAQKVVSRLAETALPFPDGLAWWTPPQALPPRWRAAYPSGYVNLGPPHGLAGILVFLARASAAGISAAIPPLTKGLAWMLGRRNVARPSHIFDAIIPIDPGGKPVASQRWGWCYGDLGICACLCWTAQLIKLSWLMDDALKIARSIAVEPNESLVPSSLGLCHGAAGTAHAFNRLYQATRDDVFLAAARAWIQPVIMLEYSQLLVRLRRVDRLVDVKDFFGGLAGIGLVVLAALSTVTPDWDQIMSISLSPAQGLGHLCL